MKNTVAAAAALLASTLPAVQGQKCIHRVTGEKLEAEMKVDAVLARAQKLQDLAYSTPGRNRQWQQPGFDLTMDYVEETLKQTNFYNIERRPTLFRVARDPANVTVDGVNYPSSPMTTSSRRELITGVFNDVPIVVVDAVGCEPANYPNATGALTLILRGNCTFELKSQFSKQAGAVGAIVRNAPDSPSFGNGVIGDNVASLVPTTMMRYEDGAALLARVQAGPALADLAIEYVNLTSYNLIATSKRGNQSNIIMAGAHADSVEAGPGVNDDGSGTVSILETAVQLAKFGLTNAVRFAWWTAEEDGLLGSYYYTRNAPADELAKIRAYLNFDMVGSNNFYGGVEGAILDPYYHSADDTVANLNGTALGVMAKGIAYAIGTYARSFDGFPVRSPPAAGSEPRLFGLTDNAPSFKLGPLTMWRV
ncbi:aminopeptidase Y [Magnaporthiopsis poae ATCC 64411]|uniref:Peptide hydrolase n=1 Tax=Magnaporthiopsis poae (strain ATCC 64411 / 73-15) TaxID=644358 RepID=A0A0C4DYC5_MAGP6|nr:aminopeptidase Y [Magnaporthiopsis poae ATCC 64411]